MLIKLLILVVVGGFIYKFVQSHGCGASCPRAVHQPHAAVCHCACATCPCSPLQRLEFIPKTLQHCYEKSKEHLKAIQAAANPPVPSRPPHCPRPFGQRSSIGLTSPLVIEESHRASHHDYERSLARHRDYASTSGAVPLVVEPEPVPRIPGVCNKCKSRGMTCMRSCPRAKAQRKNSVASNTD